MTRRLAALALWAAAGASCRTSAPPRVTAPTPPPPVTAPAPSTAPRPPAAPVVLPVRDDIRAPVIRVLLEAGTAPQLPEAGRRYAVTCDGDVTVRRGPLAATVAGAAAAAQVGAFADAANARSLAVRAQALGFAATVVEGGDGLTRVVVAGTEKEAQEQLVDRLRRGGLADARPAASPSASVTLRDESGLDLTCREARVVPLDPEPTRVGAKRVRGELMLRPRGGSVAVVNTLGLEEYLRGVVPAEMGPRAFPAVEALKAQAVAARTYAVAHLGEYAAGGYDICDSQLCQVYAGVDAEHPLTDRAVRETEGEIATWGGTPIDAMYHSTCGGHTEDAAVLLPERAAPYLKGVACTADGTLVVGRDTPRGAWVGGVERLTLVGDAVAEALHVQPRPAALASRLGGRPAGAGAAGLAAAFGLPDTAPLRTGAGGAEERLLRLLATFRLPLPERGAGVVGERWEMALVVRLAQLAGALRAVQGQLAPTIEGAVLVNERGEHVQGVPSDAVACERRSEAWRRGRVAAPAGSPATLWCAGEVCPLVEVEARSDADGASAWSWWARELTIAEVGRRMAFPALQSIAVTRRGVSGRAVTVALRGSGAAREVGAYAFRRALDLPDTLFVVQERVAEQGPALRFLGRGWGHGIGLCQNGAYGLAVAGADYRRILASYYTGIEVLRWSGAGGTR